MKSDTVISVIVPVYNGERYLEEALRSIQAQNHRGVEIIVVDDGSTDGTRGIAENFPGVVYHQQARQGAGAARNTGIEWAKGELLAFLDADDLWVAGKLSRQMDALDDSNLEAVYCHVVQFRDEFSSTAVSLPQPGLFPGAMLVRRAALARIGNFSTQPGAREVVDWHLRAMEAGLRYRVLPEVLYRRRIHSSNRGKVDPNPQGYVIALKESLDRRRMRP